MPCFNEKGRQTKMSECVTCTKEIPAIPVMPTVNFGGWRYMRFVVCSGFFNCAKTALLPSALVCTGHWMRSPFSVHALVGRDMDAVHAYQWWI